MRLSRVSRRYRTLGGLLVAVCGCGNPGEGARQPVAATECVAVEEHATEPVIVDPAMRRTLLDCGVAIDELGHSATPSATVASALPAPCIEAKVTTEELERLERLAKSSPAPVDSEAQPVDLPKPAKSRGPRPSLEVGIDAKGNVTINGTKLDVVERLLPKAKELVAKDPEIRAQINADSSATHGRVMRVVDLLKQAGVTKVAFGVAPMPPASAP